MSARPHSELQDLLGAYALDAVDPDERATIDEHLDTCPRCRAEVRDHRETVAMLAFTGQDAPSGVWEKLSASLGDVPPPIPLNVALGSRAADVVDLDERRRRSTRIRAAGLVAAAAVVISVLALAVSLRDDGGDRARFEAAIAGEPRIALASTDGRHSAHIVVTDGRGYLFNDNLPVLADDQVYQLWGRRGAELISLGLLGTDPEQERFVAGDEFDAYAITIERAGGVVSSEQVPVVAGRVITS